MEWIKTFIEFLRHSKKIIFTIFIICIAILSLDEKSLAFFKLEDFLKEYGKYIGITALVSGTYLIIEFILFVKNFILKKINIYKNKKEKKEYCLKVINKLDKEEKAILREFRIREKNTLELPIEDSAVAGLHAKRVLVIVSEFSGFNIYTKSLTAKMSISNDFDKMLTEDILIGKLNKEELKKYRPKF